MSGVDDVRAGGEGCRKLHPHLPVFGLPLESRTIVYVPGRRDVLAGEIALWEQAFAGRPDGVERGMTAARIERTARDLETAWAHLAASPFDPECLTVYLTNRCTCRCLYCYAQGDRAAGDVHAPAVAAAAVRVAKACALAHRPFRFVAHGGGEPTARWRLLLQLEAETRRIARDHGIPWWGHLATNGVLSASRAAWIAAHFNSVSVSHDGLPDIHDRQRPGPRGAPTSRSVERTIAILRQHGLSPAVRVTLLPAQVDRQPAMIEHLAGRLHVKDIRIEPAYRLDGGGFYDGDRDGAASQATRGPSRPAYGLAMAGRFVDAYEAAARRAAELGARLSFAGLRMEELHGAYCDVARQALHVVPGAVATACFFVSAGHSAEATGAVIGRWDAASGAWAFDEAAIAAHRRAAFRIPAHCRDCLCAYHCTKGCPDLCLAEGPADARPPPAYCAVRRTLTVRRLRGAAPGNADSP